MGGDQAINADCVKILAVNFFLIVSSSSYQFIRYKIASRPKK